MNNKKSTYNVLYRTSEGVKILGTFQAFSKSHAVELAYAKNRVFHPMRNSYVAKEEKS